MIKGPHEHVFRYIGMSSQPHNSCQHCALMLGDWLEQELKWVKGELVRAVKHLRVVTGDYKDSVERELKAQEREAKLVERVKELEAFIVGEAKAGDDTAIGRIREAEEKGLRVKALEFYANPSNWTHGSMSKSWAWQDNGNRARAALEEK